MPVRAVFCAIDISVGDVVGVHFFRSFRTFSIGPISMALLLAWTHRLCPSGEEASTHAREDGSDQGPARDQRGGGCPHLDPFDGRGRASEAHLVVLAARSRSGRPSRPHLSHFPRPAASPLTPGRHCSGSLPRAVGEEGETNSRECLQGEKTSCSERGREDTRREREIMS